MAKHDVQWMLSPLTSHRSSFNSSVDSVIDVTNVCNLYKKIYNKCVCYFCQHLLLFLF